MRDTQLDAYRSLSMMYIVCIIHLVYWMNFGDEPLKSLLLIEMPVIFFISGASLSFNKSNRTFAETLKSRIKRVLLPFYIYAAVMVLSIAIMSICNNCAGCDITSYSLKDILKILLCIEVPQSPYSWHLWFIQPYMILSCTFVLQQRILTKVKPTLYILMNIIAFIIVEHLTEEPLPRHIFCYNIFMLAGYCYYKKLSKKQILGILSMAAICIIALYFLTNYSFTPMQDNKFPANKFFLCYTTAVLCILALIFSHIRIPENRFVKIWNTRGYTIYLYQNMIFFAAVSINNNLLLGIDNQIISGCIMITFIFIASTLLSHITYPLEQYILSKIKFL